MKHTRRAAFLLVLALAVAALCACKPAGKALDYGKPENWAYNGIRPEKDADLFLVSPTVDMGKDGNCNMSMENEKVKKNFVGALNMERGIYEDALTLYAPYYRQASFPVYAMTEAEMEKYMAIAYTDVRAAFLTYVKNSPKDRPFVLAGFSQGADMVLRLLKEFFDQPAYQDRLVAAYCLGWRLTDKDIADCPWLKPATGAEDTGVIVCFSSEAVDITDSLIVPAGVKTHGINPLNWRTDGMAADASENLGACFTDYSGEIKKEIPHLTGAYLDPARGTLKVPDVAAEDYANSLFPDGVYHLFDYQFFFRNLQQNVGVRLAAYLASAAGESGELAA